MANCSGTPADWGSLVSLLRFRAKDQPDRIAYSFMLDGPDGEAHLSYGALDERARSIAAELRGHVAPGDRALLLYPPGLEFICALFGTFYAGAVAVPAHPPRARARDGSGPRCAALLADAQAQVVLSTAAVRGIAEPAISTIGPTDLHWLVTDAGSQKGAANWRDPGTAAEALALLQYTSGSTGAPKGVMLTHQNLLDNLALIQRRFENTPDKRGLIWLPPYHDMGLIGGILTPLYCGSPVTLMSPASFLMRPIRWLQAISRTRATASGGPNFAYNLCVEKTTVEERAGLDLSSWQLAFVGAEPVRQETLDRFAEAFQASGFRREAFYPCYGLAEATLYVTGGHRSGGPACPAAPAPLPITTGDDAFAGAANRKHVSCGATCPDHPIAIVHPELKTRCADGLTGEVWVSGRSVARGYWNRAELTANTFQAFIQDTGEGPFLRTGDLGFLKDGNLFITGRLKDMVIIHGRNHYPEDIEQTVERCHAAIRSTCCAAFPVDINGEERLVVAAEVEHEDAALSRRERGAAVDADAIKRAIVQAIAEVHDLRAAEVLLLKPRSIPRTPSGKIQRHACHRDFLSGKLNLA